MPTEKQLDIILESEVEFNSPSTYLPMTQSNEPTIELGSSQYRTIHNWLIRHYGKARKCESLKCNKKSKIFHWALRKGLSYQKNKDNYIQLCTSCHHKYDYSENNRKASRVNLAKAQQKRWRPVIKLSTSGDESGRYVSIAAAAKEIGCAPSSISEAISKNTKVRGFKWQYDNQLKQTNG